MGVQLLWFCIILCYIWQNLAGLKPQLIIWFWKGREEYVRFAFPICPQDDGTCSLASPEQGNTIPITIYPNHLAALQGCDGEGDFGRSCLWMPASCSGFRAPPASACVLMSPPLGPPAQPSLLEDVTFCSAPSCPAMESHWAPATEDLPKCFWKLNKAGS